MDVKKEDRNGLSGEEHMFHKEIDSTSTSKEFPKISLTNSVNRTESGDITECEQHEHLEVTETTQFGHPGNGLSDEIVSPVFDFSSKDSTGESGVSDLLRMLDDNETKRRESKLAVEKLSS